MEWQSRGKPSHASGTTRMHRPASPCTPRVGGRAAFACRDQGLARTGTRGLWLPPLGPQSPHTPRWRSDRGEVCRAVTSPPLQALWPKGTFWAHVSEVSRALRTAPRLSLALPCRSLLSLARCRLPSGQAATLRPRDVPKLPARPRNSSSGPSCPHPRWPTAPHSARRPWP